MNITADYDLTSLNTFAVTAKCDHFIECSSAEDLQRLAQDEYFRSKPFVVLGGGSNMLFTEDFRGNVVRFVGKAPFEIIDENSNEVTIRVAAGHEWHQLVLHTTRQQWWGIENLALIPGDCGAAAVQNIGAYGVEICQVLQQIHSVNLQDGTICTHKASDAAYGYRTSIFKTPKMAAHVIYAIDLKLSKLPKPQLSYAGLTALGQQPELTASQVAAFVEEVRRNKLPNPKELPNAGSFFMNPIISAGKFAELQALYPDMPHYVVGERYKVPAAWLIEQSGLKGKIIGKVGCYAKQPLVIVNYKGATGAEIVMHATHVQEEVQQRFGIELHPEVRYITTHTAATLQ